MIASESRIKRCVMLAGAASLSLTGALGCSGGKEFREVATPALHTGVSQIINGLLDGVFAAIEVDNPSGS